MRISDPALRCALKCPRSGGIAAPSMAHHYSPWCSVLPIMADCLPPVPVHDVVDWSPRSCLEIGAHSVGNREQPGLTAAVVRDA
jgi:hypothetical protein